ncbi:hypothetical protein [Kribbella sp. NPDC006257]|uniref:hypothetical protein n=1 Tax=Kribbella sp. NPDC006257 TaxID=3156738 RepID=UPI0033A7C79A
MTTALFLLVLVLLAGALIAGITSARQARRLPVLRTPTVSDGTGPGESYRPPAEELPVADEDEDDPTYRAVMAALEAHSKRADRKALYSNILFFAAGVLASILITLLVHPL